MEPMGGGDPRHTPAGNHLTVSRAKDVVIVQVFGLGNMQLAPTLQSFVESELKAGFVNYVIDLKHCLGLDSTFMGTFIGLTAQVQCKSGWLCLVNVSEDNKRLLTMLGILHMVSIRSTEFPAAGGQSTDLHPTHDPYSRHQQIVKAHRLLIKANPENIAVFGTFLDAMEKEMDEEKNKAAQDDSMPLPTILPPCQTDNSQNDARPKQ